MKTISVEECASCGTQLHNSPQSVTIGPYEELAFAIRKVGTCQTCKSEQDRTAGKRMKRVNYNDL